VLVEVLHPLEHFVEHLGNDGIHRPLARWRRVKFSREAGAGSIVHQRPWLDGSSTRLSALRSCGGADPTEKMNRIGSGPSDRLSTECFPFRVWIIEFR
jgi:hypothetical protein